MATAEEYAAWIVKNQNQRGTPEFDKVVQAYQIARTTQTSAKIDADPITQGAKNFANDISGPEKFMAGVGKAGYDTARGIGQLFGKVSGQDIAETRRLDAPLMESGAGMAGNVAGNIGMAVAPGAALQGAAMAARAVPMLSRAAPMLAAAGQSMIAPQTIRGGAALGATMGALQPSVDSSETLMNAGIGGIAGAIPNMIGRAMAPNTRPEVRALMNEGVYPTPGQILGGRASVAEEKLMSVPILGDAITSGRRGAVEDLNRAVYNRALNPIGQQSNAQVGREGVRQVSQNLGDAYDAVLPRIQFQPDQQYLQEIAAALNRGAQTLPPEQMRQLERAFENQIMGKAAGPASGVAVKPAQSELARVARGYAGDASFDNRELAAIINELSGSVRGAMARSNPAEAAALGNIDAGYRIYATLRNAAARTGSREGVFSPEALSGAVRSMDNSVAKGNFARGTANMQDLSDAAINVLGAKYPDSGTAGRAMMAALTAGGVGAVSPAALAVGGAASLPYLPYARQLSAALLAGERPQALQNMAPVVRALTVPATAGALNLTQQ